MKKKLFLLLALVLCSVVGQRTHAAATDYLDGWTEVTSLPTSNDDLDDYYYVFVATEADLMMAQELGTGKSGDTQEGKLTMVYRTAANPLSHTTMVWTLEYSETYKYGIRNLNNPTHLMQSRENEPYRVQFAWETVQSKWTRWNLAYASDSWTIENNACKTGDTYFSDQYIGPWTAKAFADNNVVAGNKTGDNVGHFKIYRILRSEYLRLNPTAYITNADFEASATYDKSSSATVTTNQQATFQIGDGWTQTSKGDWAMGVSVAYGSNATLNSVNAPATDPDGNDGVAVFFSAGHDNEVLFKQNSNVTLNPGTYILRYKGYNQNNGHNNILIRFGFVASDKSITPSSANEAFAYQTWVEKSIPITVNSPTEGYFQIGAQGVSGAGGSGNNAKIFIDGLTLEYTDFKAELRAVIAQAQAINARISTLSDDITTAQGVLNTASASKTAIDGSVTTLRSAIEEKLAAYTGLNAAGDDITSFIANNGFETSPTFDGTSLGSNTEPKSNATPTDGSTLLYNAKNVYQINGWELLTTETSDYARTFTMPYDKTLYVISNNAVAGQAVTSPTNESSVSTSNNDLLFVETNWCENAVLGVKQTIPLPAGSYRLTFDSYVTNAIGNAESRCGVSYGETTNYKWPTDLNTWTANEVDFTLDAQTDVTISMGYKKSANVGGASSAFLFVDNVKLTYFDPLKLAQIQWQEAWDALDALDETALPDAAETAITTALAEAEPSDVDGYNTATAALQALIDSYDEIKDAYDKVLDLIDLATDEVTNSIGTKTTIEAAISTATTNIETRTTAAALDEDYNTLETARQTYVTSDARPTAGHVFDYTFKIPDAAVTSATDWTNKRTNSGEQYTGAPDNTYFDNYNENRNIQKNIGTLRLGKYELKSATRSDAGVTVGNVYVSQNAANLNQTDIHHDGNTGGDLGNGWSWTTVAFDNHLDDKDITLGFYSECGSSKWAGADDFHLYYKGIDNVTAAIGATGWTTFASAYPLDLSKMTASTGTVKAYYASEVGGGNVTMTSTDKADVEAGTGLMLKGTPTATITIPVAASGTEIDGNMLKGCVSETVLEKDATSGYNNYVLVNNGGVAQFQSLSANGATIPAGKAYLQNGTYSAGARLTIILEDEVPTAINAIEAADTKAEGLKDGKYLVKGKIVLVKNGVKFNANGQILK